MRRFESSAPVEEEISDSVSHHALQNTGSLLDEAWHGSEESERLAYVCEELYIHTKTMVVDDRRVIIGSANLNDRSQLGNHDSEIALVIEDNESLASTMDGKPVRPVSLSLAADPAAVHGDPLRRDVPSCALASALGPHRAPVLPAQEGGRGRHDVHASRRHARRGPHAVAGGFPRRRASTLPRPRDPLTPE